MVESTNNYKQRLLGTEAIGKVLEQFDKTTLLDFRTVSQRFSDELVPRCFDSVKYELLEDDDGQEYAFPRLVKHAKKMEITNICGTEAHLRRLVEIGSNQIGHLEYLFLEFDEDEAS